MNVISDFAQIMLANRKKRDLKLLELNKAVYELKRLQILIGNDELLSLKDKMKHIETMIELSTTQMEGRGDINELEYKYQQATENVLWKENPSSMPEKYHERILKMQELVNSIKKINSEFVAIQNQLPQTVEADVVEMHKL